MMLFAALRMALNWGDDYNWLAASTLVLMFSATTVSWELLTRIARREAELRPAEPKNASCAQPSE